MLVSARMPADSTVHDLSVVHHAGSTLIVCVDERGGVWTWSLSTGEWLARPLPYAHAGDPLVAAFPDAENTIDMVAALSVDGKLLLAAGGDEQEPALWDLGAGELLWRTPLNGAYLADVIALDGALVTAQQYSEEVRLWSPDGTDTVLGEVGELSCLGGARVGDRRLILAGGSGAEVWDAATLTNIAAFDPDEGRVWAVTACAIAERTAVVAATEKGELYAWDLGAGPDELLYEPVAASQGPLETMAVMTADGRPRVVTAGQDSLRLWDAAEGFEAGHVLTRGYDVTAMESAVVDGRRALVTSGRDGVLRIWDESDLTAR
ncbi:WD40 repeat domain-containing protein [Streptomyces decoyicus]|uniref:WD40 repeat domain-containing protein n=1 Tax=Streptomyces decoyicus TaxID=249567 RepID=UPI001237717B|nr:WD40 repeat domain-containing protein [Streptomyces decoyicus]QZY19977.1 WD40 repeat domain-containing protein [Streptomyces decoyicus]